MEKHIVRLSSLTICNIKNVKSGTISMPKSDISKYLSGEADVLGIYGQNGSGKTAVIDTLFYLQMLMSGESLDDLIADYIDVDQPSAYIHAEFIVYGEEEQFELGYHVCLLREGEGVVIDREYLNCAVQKDGIRSKKAMLMDYCRSKPEPVFKPKIKLSELVGKKKNLMTDLIVARKIAEKSVCSYIFGESSRNLFVNQENSGFKYTAMAIKALYMFAYRDLFVIRSVHSGMITANLILPMAFRIDSDMIKVKGDFPAPLMGPAVLDSVRKNILEQIIAQLNIVLHTIIPGMKIEIFEYGKQAVDSGEEGWKVELMSVRAGRKAIPIRMESDGIIKIISILNVLIQAFGNPSICLAVDELDAGIFEYLLGELLDIFAKNARGQLIFTSHNLRALEMLDKDSIMFSTVNQNNRYIHMKNVKGSNNLRSMYIRSITLGGQDEMIYDETDSLKMARAFRKAGRSLLNE